MRLQILQTIKYGSYKYFHIGSVYDTEDKSLCPKVVRTLRSLACHPELVKILEDDTAVMSGDYCPPEIPLPTPEKPARRTFRRSK